MSTKENETHVNRIKKELIKAKETIDDLTNELKLMEDKLIEVESVKKKN